MSDAFLGWLLDAGVVLIAAVAIAVIACISLGAL